MNQEPKDSSEPAEGHSTIRPSTPQQESSARTSRASEATQLVAHTKLVGTPAATLGNEAGPSAAPPAMRAPTFVPDTVVPGSRTALTGGARSWGRHEMHIGQYEVIRQLGEGGMGVVHLARDVRLGRRVAIKVLKTQDRELTRRFIVEARTTARCTHENIVIIHEAGEHQGSPFMVLEFLEGRSLADYLDSDPPTIPHAVEIMVSVVRALVRAHEQGIVHRDLKPDNIFITDSGTVKVLDFGIAKLLQTEAPVSETLAARAPTMHAPAPHHATGIAGTAGYMSPEQWQTPGDVDHRADIWAVGCTLFELLSGRNPLMEMGDPLAVATFMASADPMPDILSYGAKLPVRLAAIVARCLEKDRERRFVDARELLKALEPFLPGRREGLHEQLELGPFAGLRAFQEEDASRFFGRTRELGTLLSRLRETPLMATVGPSGVGKSSFLRAGVVPALKSSGEDWEVIVVRPGRSPLSALTDRLRPLLKEFPENHPSFASLPPEPTDAELLRRLIDEPGFLGAVLRERCRSRNEKLLLFLDQFEELYTLGASAEERQAVTRALVAAADDAVSPIRVMLSIRADFVGRTTEDQDFVAELSRGLFFLGPPSEEGLREALVRPLEMVGYRFENQSIVEDMISFLHGTPNGLPLLQFTAAQLWEARDPARRVLPLASYQEMGGVSGALVSHADRIINQLSADEQNLCRTLFMHLVTQERTRAVRSMKELREVAGDEAVLGRLVDRLVESRLWVVTTLEGDPTVEVVHESLITNWPTLQRWLDESHEDSVFVDQLMNAANQWKAKKRDPGLLWRGEMVAELELFERKYRGQLPASVREFSTAVKHDQLRSTRLRRNIQLGGFVLLFALLAAAVGGLVSVNQERNKADAAARVAETRLAEQIRAEQERRQAEVERKEAEKKSYMLQGQVELNAEEIAAKNLQLEAALAAARREERAARTAMKRSEASEQDAIRATKRAEKAAEELQILLDRERERSERLNAQIGTLVEDL